MPFGTKAYFLEKASFFEVTGSLRVKFVAVGVGFVSDMT
jgi:hypothetical protein